MTKYYQPLVLKIHAKIRLSFYSAATQKVQTEKDLACCACVTFEEYLICFEKIKYKPKGIASPEMVFEYPNTPFYLFLWICEVYKPININISYFQNT